MRLRETDKIILKALSENSRETLTKMSRKTGLAITTIFDRLKILEQDLGLKYTIIITKPENLPTGGKDDYRRNYPE